MKTALYETMINPHAHSNTTVTRQIVLKSISTTLVWISMTRVNNPFTEFNERTSQTLKMNLHYVPCQGYEKRAFCEEK